MSLKSKLQKEKISAMKSKDKARSGALTLINAKIKQYEVDERTSLDNNDEKVIDILTKMVKEREGSIKLYLEANRQELADKEIYEISVIKEFLPAKLSEEEVLSIVDKIMEEVKPESMKDMGKVMGKLKPILNGKADMSSVSSIVRSKLG